MDEDKTVKAHFIQIELTVDTEGRGLVYIDPPDITPLEEEYPHTETYPSSTQQFPQEVELTASPINAYWGFKEWTGNLGFDPETPTNTLTITVEMDEPRSVKAVFKQVELTITIEGGGSVSTDPAGEVISEHVKGFAYANDVHLTAAADPGWAFKEWQGAVTGSALTASTDILLADATVTAVFEQIELTVDKQGNGVVNIDPPDITPGYGQYPHTETYGISTPENPVPVTLTATPAENWGFKEWQGDVDAPVDVASKQIDMNAPKSVTAVFEQAVLTMNTEGVGTIETTPAGETLSANTKGFRPGDPNVTDPITIEAFPGEEWGFKEWTGAINTEDNPALLEMDEDQSITAVFYQNTLTVNSTGQGQVSTGGDPQTPTFTEDFKPGKEVTLTAHAEDGWFFSEWSGAVSGASTSVNVIMSEDRTVHALFERMELTVDTQGQGTVTITPPGVTPGLGNYPHTEGFNTNQGVALSANAAAGWGFKQWIGEVTSSGANGTVTMNRSKTVTAVFAQVELTVDKEGEGTVSVSPPGGAQVLPFTEVYPYGQSVTLTATSSACWDFDHWEGNVPSGMEDSDSITIPMNVNRNVTAVFYATGPVPEVKWFDFPEHPNVVDLFWDDSSWENDGFASGGTVEVPRPYWQDTGGGVETRPVCITKGGQPDLQALIRWDDWENPAGVTGIIERTVQATITVDGDEIRYVNDVQLDLQETYAFVTLYPATPNDRFPDRILGQTALEIDWDISCGPEWDDMGTTTLDQLFITFGQPTCDGSEGLDSNSHMGEEPTVRRIDFLTDAANGEVNRRTVAVKVSDAIELKWVAQGLPPDLRIWSILDDGIYECVTGREMAAIGLMMLGIPKSHLRWECATGCNAYPSTDETTGGSGANIYYSDCTDRECPTDKTDPTALGQPCDGAECTSIPNDLLRFTSNSPAENFFKIEDDDGLWYYLTVYPRNGDGVLGSSTQGDALDKFGRYSIMKDLADNWAGYRQYWGYWNSDETSVPLFPAPDLPPRP